MGTRARPSIVCSPRSTATVDARKTQIYHLPNRWLRTQNEADLMDRLWLRLLASIPALVRAPAEAVHVRRIQGCCLPCGYLIVEVDSESSRSTNLPRYRRSVRGD